jgi:hypothetical protein
MSDNSFDTTLRRTCNAGVLAKKVRIVKGCHCRVITTGERVLQAVRRGKWKIPPPLP